MTPVIVGYRLIQSLQRSCTDPGFKQGEVTDDLHDGCNETIGFRAVVDHNQSWNEEAENNCDYLAGKAKAEVQQAPFSFHSFFSLP